MAEQRNSQVKSFGREVFFKSIQRLSSGAVTQADIEKIISEPPLDMRKARLEDTRQALAEVAQQRKAQRLEYIKAVRERDLVPERVDFEHIVEDEANTEALVTIRGGFASILARSFDPLTPPLIIVQGGPGSGKSVMCYCAINYILTGSNLTARLVNFPSFKRLHLFSDGEEWESVRAKRDLWQEYLDTEVLVMDNFLPDNRGLSAYEQQYMTELFSLRRQKHRPMMVTTPLELKYLPKAVGAGCYEAMRGYAVMTVHLLGLSRNREILDHNAPLI